MVRVLLTRPEPRSSEFGGALRAALIASDILIAPLFRAEFIAQSVPDFEAAIFTSQFGIEGFTRLGVSAAGRSALCVGLESARAAKRAGFDAVIAGRNVDDIFARIEEEKKLNHYAHFCGEVSTGALAERAHEIGKQVAALEVYRQIPQGLTDQAFAALSDSDPLILPVFSLRAGSYLSKILQTTRLRATCLIAISRAARGALDTLAFDQHITLATPTRREMITTISQFENQRI